jgi:hypothetical protein
MAIAVTTTGLGIGVELSGAQPRKAVLVITGLTAAAANTIAHGLPAAPRGVPNYQASSGTPGFETQAPDATNLYYTTGAGQTSLRVGVEY